jgi:hypothetical protein
VAALIVPSSKSRDSSAFSAAMRSAQLPLGHRFRFGVRVLVYAVTRGVDAGLQDDAEPVDHRIGGGAVFGEFVQAGEPRLGQAEPGDSLLVPGVAGPGPPETGEPGQRLQGEAAVVR